MHPHDTVQMQKHLEGMSALLGRWQGGRARLWAFQAAHCQLTIRIERRGEHSNLHVICLEPEFLHGPVQWEGGNCAHTRCGKAGSAVAPAGSGGDTAGDTPDGRGANGHLSQV